MSAFVVDAMTINRIVAWVSDQVEWISYSPVLRLAERYNIPVSGEGWEDVLAECMMELNCDAVNYRYAHHPGRSDAKGYEYRAVLNDASEIQTFKWIFGYLYQCREGDDIPKTSLYQFFNEINHEQAVKIVRELPAYDKAEWV